LTAIELATGRYRDSDLIRSSGLTPVGISVGRPKFPLGYEPVFLREAAPWGLLHVEDGEEFSRLYQARLEAFGIDAFERRFAELSQGGGLVFLCFEPVEEDCHRHLFARWLEHQTGQGVPELQPPAPQLRLVHA
jgi:hypothetical protein